MRSLNTNHWTDIKQIEGLLFFSQVVDEMLFDYTLDSYKPLALNCRLLCEECLETIEEVENGFMVEKNLQSVLEELKWSLESDLAARSLLGPKFSQYVDLIRPNDIKIKETKSLIRLISNSFKNRKYYNQLTKLIIELVKDGKNKEKIRKITGAFLTELMNYGYNSTYIFFRNSNFFFNSNRNPIIESPNIITDFLNLFDFERTSFTVVFIGGIIYRDFEESLKQFGIKVTKTYRCFSTMEDDQEFQKSKMDNESFIICSGINAVDHHSARQLAEGALGQVSALFNFFHHKEKPELKDKAIIQRKNDNYVIVSEKSIKPILKTKNDQHTKDAAKSVASTMINLRFEREQMYRFARVIDLHVAAISATAVENQLLDLWAALETLIPKSIESKKDRIVQLCDTLVPFLQLNYTNKLLTDALKDLKFWNANKLLEVLAQLPGTENKNELEKLACLIALNSNKKYRELLYNELDNFPLLKNRIFILYESMNNAKSVKRILDNHSKKANWHIRRIYRTRGLIIHSGKYPSYISLLIENLHNYLDLFLKKIMEVCMIKGIGSIDEAMLEIVITLDYQIKLLERHKDEEITVDNISDVLMLNE